MSQVADSSSGSGDGKLITWKRFGVIGKGSYGVVYEGTMRVHDEGRTYKVAVKTSSLEESASLKKEMRIYRAVGRCEEIVHCYTTMATEESFSLFLDYAALGSLRGLIRRGIPDEFHVGVYAGMIARGISSLHSKGFVHCDLKPGNILAFPVPYGIGVQLRIADLGVAKEPGEKMECWRFRGTPHYMSPESVRQGAVGAGLDVWSLGCVVLEMLTGRNPWRGLCDGMTLPEFMHALACQPLVPEIPQHVSHAAHDFLRRCLQRNPNKRSTLRKLLQHPFLSIPTQLLHQFPL